MNVGQLEHVVAAVETGSFTLAADRCGIAQPSLSASIARLERELGVPLFHRVGRRIVATDACAAMLPAARDAIRAVEQARRAAGAVQRGITGHLDVAAQPSVVWTAVEAVAELRHRRPGVAVVLHAPGDEGSIGEMVGSGRCEVGIGDVQQRSGLVWREVRTEAYVVVDAAGTPGRGSRCTVEGLRTVPLVLPPKGSPTRTAVDTIFLDAGVDPVVVVEVDHREALLPLVAAGAGATVLPESMAGIGPTTSLRVRPLAPRVERHIGVVVRDAPLTPAAAELVEIVGSR